MYKFDAKDAMNKCVEWVRNWFEENGKGCNAVIGISGGKDSSVAAGICVAALGKERVFGVLMPQGDQFDINFSYFKIFHQFFVFILCGQACVVQIAVYPSPVLQTTIIEHSQFFRYNKWHDATLQTLPKDEKPSHSTISVLKRMYAFKLHVKIKNVVERDVFVCVVFGKQRFH